MTEIANLIREFGPWVLVVIGAITVAFFGVFIWFAKRIFDEMDSF